MQATVKYAVEENFPELKKNNLCFSIKRTYIVACKRSLTSVSFQNNLVSV